jgi:hypothetical protein
LSQFFIFSLKNLAFQAYLVLVSSCPFLHRHTSICYLINNVHTNPLNKFPFINVLDFDVFLITTIRFIRNSGFY